MACHHNMPRHHHAVLGLRYIITQTTPYTPTHHACPRCFETVTLCKIRNRMNEGLCGAGQHLLDHYAARGQLPSVEGAFGGEANMGADVLRVGGADCGAFAGPLGQVPGVEGAFEGGRPAGHGAGRCLGRCDTRREGNMLVAEQ